MPDKVIGIIAFTLFVLMGWLFTFTVAGFAGTLTGVVGSVAVLSVFYLSTEAVGWLKDGPCLGVMRYISRRDRGARDLYSLFAVLIMYVLVSIPVSFAIWGWASIAPSAFATEKFFPTMLSDAMRLGFGVVLLFGFMWLFDFPARISSIVKMFKRNHCKGKLCCVKQ